MPIDSSIYQNIGQGVKSVADYDAQAASIRQNKLAEMMSTMKLDEYKRGVASDNVLAGLLAGGKTGADVATGLATQGYGQKSLDYTKAQTEQAKAKEAMTKDQLSNAKSRIDLAGQAFGAVRQNPNVETAHAALDYLGQNGVYTPDQVAQYKAKVTADPANIGSMADMAYRASLAAKDQLAKYETRNIGGSTDTVQIDPVTGKTVIANSVANTESPDAIARNERMAADAAANRSVQMRGQNMTDARSRETNAAAMSKPFEVTGPEGTPVLVRQDKQGNISKVDGFGPKAGAEKPLNDTQAKALQFGSRMQNANDILDQLASKGVTKSLPGATAGFGIGATVNALQPENRQQLDQAKRDFINAVLRRESGAAISPSEFDSAEKQYFPQPGEGAAQQAQKKAARELSMRGILAEVPNSDKRVAAVRGKPATSGIDSLLDKYK